VLESDFELKVRLMGGLRDNFISKLKSGLKELTLKNTWLRIHTNINSIYFPQSRHHPEK
jgi:hypothetical protein